VSARKAVFVDRDGTVTREGEWIRHPGALELVPGAAQAIRRLHEAGFLVVMVTNQSAVARGLITEEQLEVIHESLRALLSREGARLDAIYACPHHPTEGVGAYKIDCECRKPEPGLMLRARDEMGIDLARSWCIGDMERDLEAGRRAGVRGILVATGKGAGEEARMRAEGRAPLFASDIGAAAERILNGREIVSP
jgi:D-glycero-D-manno-heptose 1,7-bisphosphate phosphatase